MVTQKRTRREQGLKPNPWLGPVVNPRIQEPRAPGSWVSSTECVCGARYEDFNSKFHWSDGVQLVQKFPYPDSKGPVLWALRTLKLGAWYERHLLCDPELQTEDEVPF